MWVHVSEWSSKEPSGLRLGGSPLHTIVPASWATELYLEPKTIKSVYQDSIKDVLIQLKHNDSVMYVILNPKETELWGFATRLGSRFKGLDL